MVEEPPGLWCPAIATASVVKPINAYRRYFAGLLEIIFHPFRGATMIPPGKTRDAAIVRAFRFQTIHQSFNRVAFEAMRCINQGHLRKRPLMRIGPLSNNWKRSE